MTFDLNARGSLIPNGSSGRSRPPSGRNTARETNSFPRINRGSELYSGDGATIPLVYGRDSVSGLVFAIGQSGGNLYVGVAWCYGEIFSVDAVYMNGDPLPSGVGVRHYKGTTTQTADSWLVAAIAGYSDDMVLTTKTGESVGIAYSVFKVGSGASSGVPRFQADIRGKLINDPIAVGQNDPYTDFVVVGVDWQTSNSDISSYGRTITLEGSATVNATGLVLSTASPSMAAQVADSDDLDFGTDQFCIEIAATSDNVDAESPESSPIDTNYTTSVLLSNTSDASPLQRSVEITRYGPNLLLYLSSDGVAWDIADGVNVGTITTDKFYLTVERQGNLIIAYLDGDETANLFTEEPIYGQQSAWSVGNSPDFRGQFTGAIQSWRVTIGQYRYGSEHVATAIPFADSDAYTSGLVYSTNPALVWADIAESTIYGLGATTDGVTDARNWCNELLETLDSPQVTKRCEIGITLASTRRVTQWLDMMAEYANCIWYPEADKLRIQRDAVIGEDNPSGRELLSDWDFLGSSPSPWTLGDGWVITGGAAAGSPTSPEAASTLSQDVVTESGAVYAISVECSSVGSPEGSFTVEFDGTEILSATSAVGTYNMQATATSSSATLAIIKGAGFTGSFGSASVRRLYYLEERWIRDSLAISCPDDTDTPTSINVQWTAPDDSSPNWATRSAVVTLNSAANGVIPLIESRVQMPGVQNLCEAQNKAGLKLSRLYNRVEVTYTTTDHGILQRVGDAVQIRNAFRGADLNVWVESVDMVSYGRYQVSGSFYNPDVQFQNTCAFAVGAVIGGDLETIAIDTGTTSRYTQEVRGRVATDGVGRVIYFSRGVFDSASKLRYSTDGGDTFTDISGPSITLTGSSLPRDDDSWVTTLIYQSGYFYMTCINLAPSRIRHDFWSTDGVSWTEYSVDGAGASEQLDAFGLSLGGDGSLRRFVIGRDTSTNIGVAATGTGNAAGSFVGYTQTRNGDTTYDVVKLGSSWYVRSLTASLSSARWMTKFNEDATAIEWAANDWASTHVDNRIYNRWSMSDGSRFFIIPTAASSTSVIPVITPDLDLTVDDPGTISLSWPRICNVADIAYHPNAGWVCIGTVWDVSDGATETPDRIYVHYSADGVNWSSEPASLQLLPDYRGRYSPDVGKAQYIGGNKWVFATTSRTMNAGTYGTTYDNRPVLNRFTLNAIG
jgi:hypothetical protein